MQQPILMTEHRMKNSRSPVVAGNVVTADFSPGDPRWHQASHVGHVAVADDGRLEVALANGRTLACDVVESSLPATFAVGDPVVVLVPGLDTGRGVVLGRVRSYLPNQVNPTVVVQATESLTLTCGESSIEMRANGKVMIRGDDVLVRAKGTKRIRAGTVSIN